jgi:four helix bundle protein
MDKKHTPIEDTDFFKDFVEVGSHIWGAVQTWESFAKATLGKQLVRSADSVGANLVEGDGRYSDSDAIHFFTIARASAREARYWIVLARQRQLLDSKDAAAYIDQIENATRILNKLISYRRSTRNVNMVREEPLEYRSDRGIGIEQLTEEEDEEEGSAFGHSILTPNA